MEKTVYCPYINKDIPSEQSNPEHIIPLSLGGSGDFTLPVSAASNSAIGSEIDGSLANDFFVKLRRDEHGIKGHSGKTSGYVISNAADTQTGEPLRVTMSLREGFQVWSPRIMRDLTGHGRQVSMEVHLKADVAMRFVAKVALSAGYLVYGNLFRMSVAHEELRTIMNLRPQKINDSTLKDLKARADDRFREPETRDDHIIRAICSSVDPVSTVALIPSSSHFRVAVGVLGDYIGMVGVPADTTKFPNAKELEMGHMVILRQGKCERTSLRSILQRSVGAAYKDDANVNRSR